MRSGEDLARHYASGDLFLFPSLTETFGNVVPEAMASGLVVLAFDYAAAGQCIRVGENGWLVPRRDARAFTATATALMARVPEWPRVRRRSPTDRPGPLVAGRRRRVRARIAGGRVEEPVAEPRVAVRPARRPRGKARRGRILGICNRGATQPRGMHRRSNAAGLSPRAPGRRGGADPHGVHNEEPDMSKKTVLRFRTVVLSDVHLGTAECHADEVNHFLRHVQCERLILNGDIIDGWSLMRKGGWQNRHTRFVRLVLKHMEKRDTEVIYLRGNHDDVLARVLPIRMDKLYIGEDYVLAAAAGALPGGARRRLRRGDPPPSVPRGARGRRLPGAPAGEPALQPLPRVARPGLLLAEPGDQGAGQGRRELHRQLREPAPGPGPGPRLRRGHLRAHPHARRQADRRRPLPELRRLGPSR